jgi:hypothetical protein
VNRLFVGSVTAAVGLAVVAGLFVAGSPGEARARRLDGRRVEDLTRVSYAIENYYQQQKRLPASLDELKGESGAGVGLTDPATAQVYGYRVVGAARYELCATFERPSDDAADRWPTTGDWSWAHGAGPKCFQRSIRAQGQ